MSGNSSEFESLKARVENPDSESIYLKDNMTEENAPLRLAQENLVKTTAGAVLELCDQDKDHPVSKILRRSILGMKPTQVVAIARESFQAIMDGKEVQLVSEQRVVGGELCEVRCRKLVDRVEKQKSEERIGVVEAEEEARKRNEPTATPQRQDSLRYNSAEGTQADKEARSASNQASKASTRSTGKMVDTPPEASEGKR